MSGDWPPEWDDPEEEFPSGAEQDATGSAEMSEARLAEVAAYLASVPAPVMPDAVAARIGAALVAEAAARAADGTSPNGGTRAVAADGGTQAQSTAADGGTGAGVSADSGRTLGPPPARARVRRHRGGTSGHGFRSIPIKAVTSVMAGLAVIAAIGFGISRTGGATYSSSSAASGAGSENTFGVGAPAASSAASSSAASSSAASGSLGINPQFVVITSGTKYQGASLAAQVRARLSQTSNGAGTVPGPSSTSSAPAAAASKTAAAGVAHTAPTTALRACVLHLTGGQPPRLVDRATYQGDPAYVIATSSRVWVVGLGCTAANAELITSVALGS